MPSTNMNRPLVKPRVDRAKNRREKLEREKARAATIASIGEDASLAIGVPDPNEELQEMVEQAVDTVEAVEPPAADDSTFGSDFELCEDVAQFLQILHRPGDVFEIRIPDCPSRPGGDYRKTAAGWFNDYGLATEAIKRFEWKEPKGIYVTINPCKSDLLARALNRIIPEAESTTKDLDIIDRRWLLLDIDPMRPPGVSATESEMETALDLGWHIRIELSSEGWPQPLYGMSGNGCYLLYRIELPHDEASTSLINNTLKGLASRFNTDCAKIDTDVGNASRICNVMGCWKRKGDNTIGVSGVEDRPHRCSGFFPPTEPLEVVARELLEAVAVTTPNTPTACAMHQPAAASSNSSGAGNTVLKRCKAYLDRLPPALADGSGGKRTLHACCMIFKFGLEGDEARKAFDHFNSRCSPPWTDEREIAHKIRDARSKVDEAGEFGIWRESASHRRGAFDQSQSDPRHSILRNDQRTEIANAQRFVRTHGSDIR